MNFRPCIDLHNGKVKQIVGSTLSDARPEELQTNFCAEQPPSWFAELYKKDRLTGGHIIMLGPGNEEAAASALAAWPGGMQIGGGINDINCNRWLDRGAPHIIVTSWVFTDGVVNYDRLNTLVEKVGKNRLVLDLSCRKRGDAYFIVTDRWQKFTEVVISERILHEFAKSCDEFLIHAADVEGKCEGVEVELIEKLAQWTPIPTTYAGGVRDLDDLRLIKDVGADRLDATVGSALDIFGGDGITYREAVDFHNMNRT